MINICTIYVQARAKVYQTKQAYAKCGYAQSTASRWKNATAPTASTAADKITTRLPHQRTHKRGTRCYLLPSGVNWHPTHNMGNFNRDNRGGGRFGKRPQMHDAICSKCGKRCQVPFRPTGERPIFCSDCFERERDSGRPPRSEEKRMYQAVCSKCGAKCEVPFLPTGGRPTYCKDCFERGASTTDHKNTDSYKDQFASLNAKLDRLIAMLSSPTPANIAKPKQNTKKTAKKSATPKKGKKK